LKKKFGPRGVIHSTAGGKIEDTGPLNAARMPTVDEEFLGAAEKFIKKAVKSDTPFFVWFNTTRMHIFYPPEEGIAWEDRQGHARRRHGGARRTRRTTARPA
jgi:arylsulfatase A-like enzyme